MQLKIKLSLKTNGFTLIEMMISLSIIVMILALFISNYRTTNKRTDLIVTAQTLVADIHMAQNNTLGLVKYNGLVPAGGWSIKFDLTKNSYTLFADLNAPNTSGYMEYSDDEGNVRYGARVTTLPAAIQIVELKTNNLDMNNKVNVSFLPPDPKTNIYRVENAATSTVVDIKLKELQNNSYKTVRVNFLGLVEVLD